MKLTLAILALLTAGVIQLQAQEPTAIEIAWNELRAIKQGETDTSPEALAIRDQILASPTISEKEIGILLRVVAANGGQAAKETVCREIASSVKTGLGVSSARAHVKMWDKDSSGWTLEMVETQPNFACMVAVGKDAPNEFAQLVWSVIKEQSAHYGSKRLFFKRYRSTLPAAEQIEATRKQKQLLLAIPVRDELANAWLAEISADLIALQLDQ